MCPFSPLAPSAVDASGALFIDRDPALFRPLLSMARSGRLMVPAGLTLDAVLEEASFYKVPVPP